MCTYNGNFPRRIRWVPTSNISQIFKPYHTYLYCKKHKSISSIFSIISQHWNDTGSWNLFSCMTKASQIAKLMGSTWDTPGSCRPQMGPMLAPWTLLSGMFILGGQYHGCWWLGDLTRLVFSVSILTITLIFNSYYYTNRRTLFTSHRLYKRTNWCDVSFLFIISAVTVMMLRPDEHYGEDTGVSGRLASGPDDRPQGISTDPRQVFINEFRASGPRGARGYDNISLYRVSK